MRSHWQNRAADRSQAASDMQLDIFEHSRDVMLRNDVLQALLRRDASHRTRRLASTRGRVPERSEPATLDRLVGTLEHVEDTPSSRPRHGPGCAAAPARRVHPRRSSSLATPTAWRGWRRCGGMRRNGHHGSNSGPISAMAHAAPLLLRAATSARPQTQWPRSPRGGAFRLRWRGWPRRDSVSKVWTRTGACWPNWPGCRRGVSTRSRGALPTRCCSGCGAVSMPSSRVSATWTIWPGSRPGP